MIPQWWAQWWAHLAVYIGSGLADVAKDIEADAKTAGKSGGSATHIDAAARRMADGVGRLFSLVLQGIAAYVSAQGIAAAMKQLSSSRLGPSLQRVFGTEAFEQALGKHIVEQTKPLPNRGIGTRSRQRRASAVSSGRFLNA
jgi:hypothetical protein